MAKIIMVSGTGNTGKTSAIKGVISQFCNCLPKPIGDITIITPIKKKAVFYHVGFASGGDRADIIQDNIDFFEQHQWDCLVFACKSYGATLNLLNQFAATKGITPIYIPTTRQSPSAIFAYNAVIVSQIAGNIP